MTRFLGQQTSTPSKETGGWHIICELRDPLLLRHNVRFVGGRLERPVSNRLLVGRILGDRVTLGDLIFCIPSGVPGNL
jgi:hypothetical protein